jgi:hypothetical protein
VSSVNERWGGGDPGHIINGGGGGYDFVGLGSCTINSGMIKSRGLCAMRSGEGGSMSIEIEMAGTRW